MPNDIQAIASQLNKNPEFKAWAVRCAIIHTLFSQQDNASPISDTNIRNYASILANKAFKKERRFHEITQPLENTEKRQLKLNCQKYIEDLSQTIKLNDMIHYSVLQYTGKSVKHRGETTISQSVDKLLDELTSMKAPTSQTFGGMVPTKTAGWDNDYKVLGDLIKDYKQTHSKSLLADWLLNIDALSTPSVLSLLFMMITMAILTAAELGLVSSSFAIAATGILLGLVTITGIAVCNANKGASFFRQHLRNEAQLGNDDKMLVIEEATLSPKNSKGLPQKDGRLPSITLKKVEGLVQERPIISDSTAESMVRPMAPTTSNSNFKQQTPVVIPAMQVTITNRPATIDKRNKKDKYKIKKKTQAVRNQSTGNTSYNDIPNSIQIGKKKYRRIIESKTTANPRYIHFPSSLFAPPKNMSKHNHNQFLAVFNNPKIITQQKGANGIKIIKTSKIKENDGLCMWLKVAKAADHTRVGIKSAGKSPVEGYPIYEAQGFTKR